MKTACARRVGIVPNLALAFVLAQPVPLVAQWSRAAPHAIPAPTESDSIPLYGVPPPDLEAEQWEIIFREIRIVRNVVTPTLTPVLPAPAKATGTAVIVAPGGAFRFLSIDVEGTDVARWLADRGVAAFVLKYRTEQTAREPEPFVAHMTALMEGLRADAAKDELKLKTPSATLEDTQAAVKLVRQRASEWKVDPRRVGLLGFSAGSLAAVSNAVAPDQSGRADFIGAIYGLLPQPVPDDASPMFAAIALDDPFFTHGVFDLITAWRKANRPVELHLYAKGGHGFALRPQGTTSDLWAEQFCAWIKAAGILDAAK